ncbi:hypothetical protein TNCV_1319361 [Trichonephila clavipes]|nr:hypothetical protein TNCV_1319361 [Trichonephila clavipes]
MRSFLWGLAKARKLQQTHKQLQRVSVLHSSNSPLAHEFRDWSGTSHCIADLKRKSTLYCVYIPGLKIPPEAMLRMVHCQNLAPGVAGEDGFTCKG